MKSFLYSTLGLAILAAEASGHYIFEHFTYSGVEYPAYTYVRTNTNYNSPVTLLTSNDLRCNQGGETSNGTTTLTVKAGQQFSFTADIPVYHDGPLSIYMAKAPTTAIDFDGSGDVWFKILDIGPDFSSGTAVWNLYQTYTYTIPPNLPSGDYLLRIQQLGIHNPYPAGIPQFYIECAQITVTNGGSGTPGPLVSIPGFITGTEPGYTVNIYSDFYNYTVPGPAVWAGQGGSSSYTGVSSGGVATATATIATSVAPTTTLVTSVVATTTGATTTTATAAAGGSLAKYAQCGGTGWTGSGTCVSGTTCTVSNSYYSQCL